MSHPSIGVRLDLFSQLVHCNPFLAERRQLEARLLGTKRTGVWTIGQDGQHLKALRTLAETTLASLTTDDRETRDATHLEDLAFYTLYYRHVSEMERLIRGEPVNLRGVYQTLKSELSELSIDLDPAELLGCFFQVRRAFEGIHSAIVGSTGVAARLRANIWESIFTHDMRRFWKTLLHRAADFPTLITGPSGTGKELVARAIAMGRFIPFNVKRFEFEHAFDELMLPLNLSALSPQLIESELFGHRRGAFTGALEDRIGWLETCCERGVVFLDEIGELDRSLQVKLLRVLQEGTFNRLGESKRRTFRGKIVAATNRSLADEMAAGRFRQDLYYRLCADIIQTPALAELTGGDRDELRQMVRFIAAKLLPAPAQCERLTDEVMREVDRHVGRNYEWPGNFRELEQCTRNVLIRGTYAPAAQLSVHDRASSLVDRIERLELSADELLSEYCRIAHLQTGSYRAAAGKLKIDRRTLRAKAGTSTTRPTRTTTTTSDHA